jgi:hypothetical protein
MDDGKVGVGGMYFLPHIYFQLMVAIVLFFKVEVFFVCCIIFVFMLHTFTSVSAIELGHICIDAFFL